MVVALAGRRISAPGSNPLRFPVENVSKVRERLEKFFASTRPEILVSSGACGADLLALEVAGSMGILRSIVLPFEPPRFKTLSVIDRPGDWGPLFDKICKEVEREEKIQVQNYAENDDSKYFEISVDILQRAEKLSEKYDSSKNIVAVIVWDGEAKTRDDATLDFKIKAAAQNCEIVEISTL